MNVAQLIQALQKLDQQLPVVVRGYEDGVNDVQKICPIRIERDARKGIGYYGQHDYAAGDVGEAAIELWGDNPEDEAAMEKESKKLLK